jgi:hypothetical protein
MYTECTQWADKQLIHRHIFLIYDLKIFDIYNF